MLPSLNVIAAILITLQLELIPAPREVPCLRDMERFPPYEVCKVNYDFAHEHVKWLEGQVEFYKWREQDYFWWLQEAKRRKELWKCAKYARDEEFSDSWRRDYVDSLVDMLGNRDFYMGKMPDPVPVGYFREVGR